ncbi:MAG: SsrA-binding protein SmpB [Patescibacteria group bacterium]
MKIYAENRKAGFDYEILEKYEAGLVLIGQEVKSIKNGRMNLTGSYVVFRGAEPYLVGAKVPPWQAKNAPQDYNPEQSRKLLLNKKEINYLFGKANEKGFSLIPLKVYDKNGRIKLEFGLAKGKKKYDKKEKIKSRDIERQTQRELSSRE